MFKLSGPFSSIPMTKGLLMVLIAGILVVLQSLGVIYIKHTKRIAHTQIQDLYRQRDKLQVEWSQLLLELSTWQSDARVERVAREKLGMVVPDKVNVLVP